MTTITVEQAARVLETVDAGLIGGLGDPQPGQMCVEAAVCFALGLPHDDQPACVAPTIRSFVIRLNDAEWSSKGARAKGMRRLAIAQLGSAGHINQRKFVDAMVDKAIRVFVPRALREAAKVQPDERHRLALTEAAERCERDGDRAAAEAAGAAAAAAAEAGWRAAAEAGWRAEAAAAAGWRAEGWRAAAEAAGEAAAAAAAAAEAAGWRAAAEARDDVLSFVAEETVKVLIALDAPGCAFLDLAPAVAA